jgi:hypothetical protein
VDVPQVFQTIESSALSTWIRDSPSLLGFWFILAVHAVGMTLLVGASAVIDLRILGVARDLPLTPLKKLYGIIWIGFWLQFVSGTLLLIASPTKSLTNLDFYLKMLLIALAVVAMQIMKTRVFSESSLSDAERMAKGKALAAWSLIFWAGAVTAGRLIAYTYTYVSYPG